eukprot:gene12415-biopygen9127
MQYDACKIGLKSSNLIEIVEITLYDNNIKSVLQSSYNKKPYVGIVCNGYRQLERQVLPYASGTSWCAQNGVVDIAPLFNSDVWRQWLPPLIWASAAPAVETALLLKYATVVLRISRLVIFDATDSDFPNAEKVLTKAGSGAGTVLSKFTQTMNPTALVAMKPQMALIYPAHWYRDGFSRWPTLKLLTSEPGLVDLIVSPMMDSYGITEREMAKGLKSKIAPGYNQRIIMCSTNHLARDLQYTEIQAFQSDWRSFSGGVQLDKDDPNGQMFAVAGWVQGKFASILMALPEAQCTTGHALANYLFYGGTAFVPSDYSKKIKMGGGNAFDLYDYHLGGYAVSSSTACTDTDQCRCNQGGRAVWLYEVGIDTTQKKFWKIWHLNESFAYTDRECYYDPATFPSFVTVTMLYPKEKTRSAGSGLGVTQIPQDFLNRIADQMKITIGTTDNREVSVGHMDVDETTDWTQLQADLPSQVYIGSAVPGMKLTNKLALNMIPTNGAKPAADPFDPNALSVTPTLQQSIYDCYGMLLTNAPGVGPDEVYRASFVGEVKFFYANVDEAKLDALAKAAAKEWNQKEPGAPLPLTRLSAAFSKNCVNFVVGGMGQEEEIMTLLNENPDAFVFLPWDDYIQMYPALQAACAKVGERAQPAADDDEPAAGRGHVGAGGVQVAAAEGVPQGDDVDGGEPGAGVPDILCGDAAAALGDPEHGPDEGDGWPVGGKPAGHDLLGGDGGADGAAAGVPPNPLPDERRSGVHGRRDVLLRSYVWCDEPTRGEHHPVLGAGLPERVPRRDTGHGYDGAASAHSNHEHHLHVLLVDHDDDHGEAEADDNDDDAGTDDDDGAADAEQGGAGGAPRDRYCAGALPGGAAVVSVHLAGVLRVHAPRPLRRTP